MSEDPRLAASFQEAAAVLAAADVETLLEPMLESAGRIRAIAGAAGAIDHVGFLAVEADGHVARAATEAGFGTRHRAFASTILARRLGRLTGRDTVPTTIFKAERADGRTIEVATPHDVSAGDVRGWVDERIGFHVALRLDDPSDFAGVRRLLAEEGWSLPAFMDGEALTNPAERVTAMFFERPGPGTLELELCHFAR